MQRFALGIQYDGTLYHGWQMQESVQNIQGVLEAALSYVANHPVKITCAGRTDAGVHASGQVVHFDTYATRRLDAWVLGTNSQLPSDIRVVWSKPVDDTFHARYSAKSRRYHYWIHNARVKPALMRQGMGWCYRPLDAMAMHRAAQCLVGEHDFSSFQGAGCQSRHPTRTVLDIAVARSGPLVRVNVSANAFLLHMVRNIVGALMAVGIGAESEVWMAALLAARDRTKGRMTVAPHGLYLVNVVYPTCFEIPTGFDGPWFGEFLEAV
ncbi:MAG: tRNA pseudouridine(38-40) synthase TruA [Gammaproteobacteria bacterium RIFCSPHIGHO2_12_FULL_45_9]|nr:MAG: tRNA pseudouridine(38-40) synthase TruA [Gammaproteobacteria bacterium RIFCSPHIGHO2_12_FULL_45_9]